MFRSIYLTGFLLLCGLSVGAVHPLDPRRPVLAWEETPGAASSTIESEIREYSAENGYKIALTSRGNIIGLEIPGGVGDVEGTAPREGYVISYVDGVGVTRVVHDVYNSYSDSIVPGTRDFIVSSFTAPPSRDRIPLGAMISATAVVDTLDGLLRLRNEITWRAGTGIVNVRMTVTNRSSRESVKVINVKRVLARVLGPVVNLETSILSSSITFKCICPPPPPPWTRSIIIMNGVLPSNVLIARADDPFDLQNVGPGAPLGDVVTGIKTQGVFLFQINNLVAPLGSVEANVSQEAR